MTEKRTGDVKDVNRLGLSDQLLVDEPAQLVKDGLDRAGRGSRGSCSLLGVLAVDEAGLAAAVELLFLKAKASTLVLNF